jgi:hypothetical protein
MHPLAFAEVPAPTAIPNTSNATTTFIMKSPLSLLMSQETHACFVPSARQSAVRLTFSAIQTRMGKAVPMVHVYVGSLHDQKHFRMSLTERPIGKNDDPLDVHHDSHHSRM